MIEKNASTTSNQEKIMPASNNPLEAIRVISEPLRSIATRLAYIQCEIQEDCPGAAKNIEDVRKQLAHITQVAYDAIGVAVPAIPATHSQGKKHGRQ